MIELLKRILDKVNKPFVQPLGAKPAPSGFKGRIVYEPDKCISCGLCVRFCPSKTIKMKSDRKITLNLTECCYCQTCEEVCPTKCIRLTEDYNLVSTKKKSREWKVG